MVIHAIRKPYMEVVDIAVCCSVVGNFLCHSSADFGLGHTHIGKQGCFLEQLPLSVPQSQHGLLLRSEFNACKIVVHAVVAGQTERTGGPAVTDIKRGRIGDFSCWMKW